MADKSKGKDNILNLAENVGKTMRVKFAGGREVVGVLIGYDTLLNLVLDQATEFLRDPEDPTQVTDKTRVLGMCVCRGPSIIVVAPEQGIEEIDNPWA